MATNSVAISSGSEATSFSQGAVVVLGRFFFVLIFLMSGPLHFSKQEVAYAAAQGVPLGSRIGDLLLGKMKGAGHQENQHEEKPSQNDYGTLGKACCLRTAGNCRSE